MKKILFAVLGAVMISFAEAKDIESFQIKDGDFVLNGAPVRIIAGEMHYPRIPHQYWRHRFKMLKGMGLNAVATCVFWNIHQPEPNVWDWSGDKNLAEFITTAQQEGLMVILRPGPYICAEWEYGGYPWWFQNIEGMEVRRNNEQFLKYTREYLTQLYQQIGHLQCTKGGPIVMVQVENEFGSYASQRTDIPMEEHKIYNAKIKDQILAVGFDAPLFTSDGTWLFEGGSTPGALPTGNGENNVAVLKERVNKYHSGKGPYMVAEFYPGWLMHWCEPFPRVDAGEIARKTEEYLQQGVSFNYYMVHGGTNFGFTSGANYNDDHDIQPDLTSYDYDAPITEAGWVTPKYDSLRNVIAKYVDYTIPSPAEKIDVLEIPEIKLDRVVNVLEATKRTKAVSADSPMTFEQLGQGHGYVLYSRQFNQPISGKMIVEGLRDYATVYVNGKKVGVLNRYNKEYSIDIDIPFNATLDILVENMGRINYGAEIVRNNKGIISPIKIGEFQITGGWKMYKMPFDQMPDASAVKCVKAAKAKESLKGKPVLYHGEFNLDKAADTFLNMSSMGKGIVFVNGKNLGRFWNDGPQQTLYLPGVWLREGENKIVVFDQLNDNPQESLSAVSTPILDYQDQ